MLIVIFNFEEKHAVEASSGQGDPEDDTGRPHRQDHEETIPAHPARQVGIKISEILKKNYLFQPGSS